MVKLSTASVPYSTVKMAILKLLEREGFVDDFEKKGKKVHKHIVIQLRYQKSGAPAISGLRRISKPGRRVYKKASELYPIRQGTGIAVVSTPKGLMTDKEARKAHLGGEILCEVW